jgi:hypothetical protein
MSTQGKARHWKTQGKTERSRIAWALKEQVLRPDTSLVQEEEFLVYMI